MDNQNSTAKINTSYPGYFVEEDLEKLDESKHYNSVELVRIINKLIDKHEKLENEVKELNQFLELTQ